MMLYSTDPAVRGGREELCPGLAGNPHRLEDGLGVGRGETDLPHRFAVLLLIGLHDFLEDPLGVGMSTEESSLQHIEVDTFVLS